MRLQVVIDAVPGDPGTILHLEVWDYQRESRVRPLYELSWVVAASPSDDGQEILKWARDVAYIAYARIGAELDAHVKHRPLGL